MFDRFFQASREQVPEGYSVLVSLHLFFGLFPDRAHAPKLPMVGTPPSEMEIPEEFFLVGADIFNAQVAPRIRDLGHAVRVEPFDREERMLRLLGPDEDNGRTIDLARIPEPKRPLESRVGWALISLAAAGVLMWLAGPLVGAAMFLILFAHEHGHAIGMRLVGLRPKGVFFIPFLGGVAIYVPTRDARREAIIAAAGPVAGLLATVPVAGLGWLLGGADVAGTIFSHSGVLHLFNLLPIGVLDGGRLLRASLAGLGPRAVGVWAAAAVALLGWIWWTFAINPFLLALVAFMSVSEARQERREPQRPIRGIAGILPVVTLALLGAVSFGFLLLR